MLEVYEFLESIKIFVCACDDFVGYTFDELQKIYSKSLLFQLPPQRLIDLVEEAIRCADKSSKEATIKRLNERLEKAILEFSSLQCEWDFRDVYTEGVKSTDVDREKIIEYALNVKDVLESFSILLNELCSDFKIKNQEINNESVLPDLSAWEGAVAYFYEFGKFITSEHEAEQAIKHYAVSCSAGTVIRKCRGLRTRIDIVGYEEKAKDNKLPSLMKVRRYLELKKVPTNEIENDIKSYLDNKDKEKIKD